MRNMATALINVNIPLKETHNLLKSMGQTLTNTIKWSIASNAINTVTGSVQKAWSFTKQLDTSLNDIMIVTGKSADEMERFAQKANTAAKNLGATTNQYAQAALIYYQQGLAEQDVMSRSDVTVKAANVTGQSTQAVSEQLTAIWNGYKTSAAEAELYIDKVSAVAATTAADLEELSTGMSKVASAANAMGVDIDQLNAQLATIVSVTRQDSAVVGTALKTIYSRMGDLMVDGEDEFGTKLGEVSSNLKTMGIDVLDAQGNLRDMGIVIEEVAGKWNTWTDAQQQAAAVAIAGKRQYNNLIALFENWDMYESAKATSQNSVGTLQKQQETYLDSLDARFDKLQATAEDLYLSLLDADSFKEILDIITKLVDKLGDFSDAIGGGGAVLSMLVPLMTQMFSGTVSKGISTFVTNMQQGKTTAEALKTSLANIDTILESDSYDQAAKDAAAFRKELNLLYQSGVLTNEEYQAMNDTLNSTIDTFNKASKGQIATEESKRIYKDMSTAFTPNETIANEALVNQAGELYAKAGTSGQAILSTEDKTILEEYDQSLNAIKEAYGEAAISAEMFVEAVEKTNRAYQKNKDKDFEEAFGQLENNYTSAREALEQFKKAGLITAEEAERATKSLTRAMSNWNEDTSPEAIEEFRREMEKVNQVFEKAETNFTSAGKVISSGLKDAATETEKAKAAAQGLQDVLKTGLAKHTLEQDIQAFMNLTSTITSAISAFTILSNIGNIWDNEDLTVMQKMGQTITNLLTAAGMALPIVKLITIETKKISAEGAKQIVLEGLKAQAKDAANKEGGEQLFYENLIKETIKDEVKQQAMLLGLEKEETREKIKQLALDKAAEEKSKNQKGDFGKGLKERWDTFSGDFGKGWNATKGAPNADGVSRAGSGGKGAFKGITNTQSKGELLGRIAPYAAAAAVVIGVTVAAHQASKYFNEQEQKAWEKSKEQVEATNQALAQTKQEYDNITNSISNLNNLETSMDDMVEGSVEWQKALADVNAEVLELLEKYPELATYIERQENGMLKLSDEGAELAQQKALDRMQAANVANMQAKISAQNAEAEYLKNELAEGAVYGSQNMADATAASPAVAAATLGTIGAVVGSFIPVLGTVIGAAIGAGAGAIIGGINMAIGESEEEQFKDKLEDGTFQEVIEAYKTSGERIFDSETALKEALGENTNVSEELIDSLIDNKEETKKLVAELAKNQALERQQYIESGRTIAGPDASDGLAYIAGYQAKIASDAAIAEVKKEMGGGNKADKEAAAQYLAKVYGLSADAITGAKGVNKVQYTKDGGSYELDMDTVYGYFASLKGAEATKENLSAYADAIEKLEKTTSDENAQKALNQLATGVVDFSNLTKESLDTLQEHLGEDVLNQIAKLTGKTVTELKKEYEDSLQDSKDAWDVLKERIHEPVEEALKVVDNSSLSLQQAQQYRDLLVNAWDTFGESGVKAIDDLVSAFGDDADLFIQKLQTLDWTSSTVENDLLAIINAFGVDINPEVFEKAASKLKILGDYYTNFDIKHLEEQYANLENIRKKLKATGDIISAEEFEKLGAGWDDYFVKMADGTYALIKSAEEFNKVAKSTQKSQAKTALIDQLQNYSTRVQEAEKREHLEDALASKEKEYTRGYAAYSRYDTYMSKAKEEGRRLASLPNSANSQAIQWLKDNKDFVTSTRSGFNKFYEYINTPGATNFLPENWKEQLQSLIKIKAEREYIESIGGTSSIEFQDLDYYMRKGSALAEGIASYKEKISGLAEFTEEEQKAAQEKISASAEQFFATATNITELREGLALLNEIDFISDKDKQKYLEIAEKQKILIENERLSFELEYDKYELQEKQLEVLNRQLEITKELQNNAADKDKVKYLQEQNEILEQQIKAQDILAYDKSLDAADKKTEFLKAFGAFDTLKDANGNQLNLFDVLAQRGVTAEWDNATGRLSNANEFFEAAEELMKEEGVWDTDEGQEAKDAMALYEEYLDLLDDVDKAEDERRKAQQAIWDNNAAIIQQTLNNKAKIKDLKLAYQDFQRSLVDEGAHDDIAKSYLADYDTIYAEAQDFEERRILLAEAYKNNFITAAEYQKQLEALNSEAQDNLLKKKELEQAIEEELVSAIEARNEAYDEYIDKIEQANDLYQKQVDLMKLAFGEQNALSMSTQYYDAIANSYADILEKSYEKVQANKADLDALANNTSDETYKTLLEAYTDSVTTYFDNLQSAIQAVQNAYFNAIDASLWEFEKAATGGLGLNKINEEWEWRQKLADRYLDTTNRIYETSVLAYEFDKAARSTTSLNAQKAINDAKEQELKILREKDKLTQYDLDRAKLRLEITQAEIALQEAQANKTQMRLTRGADGTYSYQYVADMNKVEEKKQELAELNNELYNLDKAQYESNLEEVYDIFQTYVEKMRELSQDADGLTAADLEELEKYKTLMNDIVGENADVWTYLDGLYDSVDGGYEKLASQVATDAFSALEKQFTDAISAATSTYSDQMAEFQKKLTETNGTAQSLLAQFNALVAPNEKVVENAQTIVDEFTGENGILANLKTVNEDYDTLAESLDGMITSLNTEVETLIGASALTLNTLHEFVKQYIPDIKNNGDGTKTSRLGYETGATYTVGDVHRDDTARLAKTNLYQDVNGAKASIASGSTLDSLAGQQVELLDVYKDLNGDEWGLIEVNGSRYWISLDRALLQGGIYSGVTPTSYDTGGYTGDWGSTDGRLAMLHRKELVLNEDDTKNFLSGINVLRSLDNSMFSTMGRLLDTLDFGRIVSEIVQNETIEQKVEITANFPYATDKDTIIEAINEVVNLAAQQATKNSRQ